MWSNILSLQIQCCVFNKDPLGAQDMRKRTGFDCGLEGEADALIKPSFNLKKGL